MMYVCKLYNSKQRGLNGVNKPVTRSPLQDSPFIRSPCRYKYCNKKPYLPQCQDGNTRTTTRLWVPVNQFLTLMNIVYFAVSLLVYLGTKEVSMFCQSERLDFQTTIERTCTEFGDSWADKIRSSIAFAQDHVAAG